MNTAKSNTVLVALPKLDGTAFERTAIWLWTHSTRTGSQGVVLNRPSMVDCDQLIEEMGYPVSLRTGQPVHQGGPVTERALSLVHSPEWFSSNTQCFHTVSISSDMFMLEKMAAGNTPRWWRMFAGKSAWAPGQLEREIADGYWYVLEDCEETVSSERTGQRLWEDAIHRLSSKAVSLWF